MTYKTYKKSFAFLAIAVLIFIGAYLVLGGYGTSGPSSAPNLEEHGLVGYWNMEAGTGQTVYDRSGNGNNGTLGANSSVAKDDPVFTSGYSSAGPGGTALQFDGVNDYVGVPNDFPFQTIHGPSTVELWFNANSLSGVKRLFSDSCQEWGIYHSGATIYGAAYSSVNGGTVSTGQWYHVVLTHEHPTGLTNTIIKIYVNGVLKDQTTLTITTQNGYTDWPYKIGADSYPSCTSDDYFNGSIDEVRIYNRALSTDEIRQHYNQKKPIAEWKFDEGSGTSTKDESFNNNDGTLNLGSGGNTTVANAWIQGKYGSAISFDGTDDYVSVADSSSWDFPDGTSFSYGAWFKPSSLLANQYILARYGAGDLSSEEGLVTFLFLSSTTLSCTVREYGSPYGSGCSASYVLTDFYGWHNAYCVKDDFNNKIILYYNGNLVKQTSLTTDCDGGYSGTDNPIIIGGKQGYMGSPAIEKFFNGSIDEPRIYNYARTQDEILTDYNAGKAAHLGKDNQRDDGLVGYWNMEEGTGQTVYDRSGNSNNGTLGANSSVGKDDPVFTSGYSSAGPGGTALQFDGVNDYVLVSHSSSLNVTQEITITAWLKPNIVYGQTLTQDRPAIYRKISSVVFHIDDRFTNGSLQVEGASGEIASGSKTWNVGQWYFLAFTYKASTSQKLYINGIEVASSGNLVVGSSTNDIQIGQSFTENKAFNGLIDEVRIYNRALSADEIRQHYNQKKPILEMKFDEGSGTSTKDESFNNNDGTLNLGSGGNTTVANAWVQGKFGSAISFDGTDDYVNAGSGASLNITGEITVEAWVKFKSVTGSQTILWRRGPSGSPCYSESYIIHKSSSGVYFDLCNGTSLARSDYFIPSTDVFYHFIGTRSGNTMYFYVNGTLYGSPKTLTGNIVSGTYNLYIGDAYSTPAFPLNGTIDDVRIYNYARTQDEILSDYNAGKAAHLGKDNQRDDGLVGYWNMEEGTGQTVYDRSGNGNNGTLGASTAVAKDDPVFTSGYSSAGPGGTALKFDGVNDYVNCGNAASLNSIGTIEFWAKVSPTGSNLGILQKYDWSPERGYLLNMPYYDGYPYFEFVVDGNIKLTTSVNPYMNQWAHYVITMESTITRMYINGVQKNTGSGGVPTANSASLDFGRDTNWAGKYYSGLIDEVRIYNRALSADEIRQHYNQKKPILEMKFDEGSGTSTKDESFNNNDGTLNLGAGGNTTVANAWVQGKYGSAISFDGTDDYVQLSPSSLPTQAITVSAWVKVNVHRDWNDFVVNRWSSEGDWLLFSSETSWYWGIRYPGTTQKTISTPHNNSLDWHHLVGTYNGSIQRFYVDGVEVGTPQSFNVTLTQANLLINDGSFNGLIDDVRIYNYARTPDEIKVDYNAGLAAHFR